MHGVNNFKIYNYVHTVLLETLIFPQLVKKFPKFLMPGGSFVSVAVLGLKCQDVSTGQVH